MTDLFEIASREKYRFSTTKGHQSVEQLWDLPLKSTGCDLNSVAQTLSRQLKTDSEEDFVSDVKSVDKVTKNKLDIVKHIIKVKKEERDLRKASKEKALLKARILEALEKKKGESLDKASEEELLAQLEALG